ncbi:MAG: UbiA family prenyltransferase [Alphaproteobacteria bacterium]|nr:UbiA family prenyltransferase [Alphaproteobacteria bacterium]
MDHTLLRTDILMEGIAAALFHRPWAFLAALPSLLGGRPAFKRAIAKAAGLDASTLPLREDLVSLLEEERARGRTLLLATAADEEAARAVAARTGLFARVIGSTGRRNLKGGAKRRALAADYPDGFSYAGDSNADLAVWKGARSAILVGAAPHVAATVRRRKTPIEAELPQLRHRFGSRLRALRPHQWAKNLLIFAPLFLAHMAFDPQAALATIYGFALLCLAASSGYVLNDLGDLEADRRHPTKRLRPLASGDASVGRALFLAPIGLLLSAALGFLLSPGFAIALLAYIVITAAYSMGLKRIVFFDAVVLGSLYTLRLVMGAEAAGVAHSQWLLTFSMFFFSSLSLAKRHVEVMRLNERDGARAAGRGYYAQDWPLTLAFGAAGGVAAVLILVLYLVEEAFAAALYSSPAFLWAAPVAATLALGRLWVKAHRRQLDDDPMAFALRDRPTWLIAFALGVAFILASVL